MLVSEVIDTDFAEQCKILAERVRDGSEYVIPPQRRSTSRGRVVQEDDEGDEEVNGVSEENRSDDYETGKIFKRRY
jgi:hypothetical protein